MSWADRIAYVCHDWEDAVCAGIVAPACSPPIGRGPLRRAPRRAAGRVHRRDGATSLAHRATSGWPRRWPSALAAFRAGNYEHIYLREASVAQGAAVDRRAAGPRRALRRPAERHPGGARGRGPRAAEPRPCDAAVTYVAGMTDRFACRQAVARLGWDPDKLPQGIDA